MFTADCPRAICKFPLHQNWGAYHNRSWMGSNYIPLNLPFEEVAIKQGNKTMRWVIPSIYYWENQVISLNKLLGDKTHRKHEAYEKSSNYNTLHSLFKSNFRFEINHMFCLLQVTFVDLFIIDNSTSTVLTYYYRVGQC